MKKTASMLILCVFFLSNLSQASGYMTSLGTGVEINKVQILGSGGMVVWLKNEVPKNPDGCNEKLRLYVKPDLANFDAMVSAVLAAHAQNKTVGFWSSGCGTNYFWGGDVTFPIIRDLWVN